MGKYTYWLQYILFMAVLCMGMNRTCFATGPSWAKIQIVPISYNDGGILLCKTRYSINSTGVQSLPSIEYGWLVVSADGIWEEHLDKYFDAVSFQNEDRSVLNDFNLQEYKFNSQFNWASPPTSVHDILEKYNFQARDMNPMYDVKDIFALIQDMVKNCSECEKRQRSLHNLTAPISEDETLDIVFYHHGVIFLKNVYDESQHTGSVFGIPNFMTLHDNTPRDYGIEMQYIDGIVILPKDD